MSAVQDPMPQPAARADAAYLDFVEGFRAYLLGEGSQFESRLEQELLAEGQRRGAPLVDIEQIRAHVEALPIGQLRNRLARTQQEMKWQRLTGSFEAQRAALSAELARYDGRGPGRLLLDPAFNYPPYLNVNFHLQPGGYFKDELSGFLYHYGTKVFFRGDNDHDELHARLVAKAPAPADGRVSRVLDLACSIGQSTTAFKRRFPEAEIWGIDYSAPMLRAAHRRGVMLDTDVNFAQRLIESTQFPAAHFDMSFAFIVFHELPLRIIRETVRETARVTRPGGVFTVFDFIGSEVHSPFQRYHRYFDARHNGEPYSQDFCDCRFGDILDEYGFDVAAAPVGQRAGGTGYMQHWFAVRR